MTTRQRNVPKTQYDPHTTPTQAQGPSPRAQGVRVAWDSLAALLVVPEVLLVTSKTRFHHHTTSCRPPHPPFLPPTPPTTHQALLLWQLPLPLRPPSKKMKP